MTGTCTPKDSGIIGNRRPWGWATAVLLILIGFSTVAADQQQNPVFERIKQYLPRREVGWRLAEADEPFRHRSGVIQASYVWSSGVEEVRATVIMHNSSKAARAQFKRLSKGEPAMESFRVNGFGDEAYLFPPIILHQDGPFNLRFRKARFEISMSADSKVTLGAVRKLLLRQLLRRVTGCPRTQRRRAADAKSAAF